MSTRNVVLTLTLAAILTAAWVTAPNDWARFALLLLTAVGIGGVLLDPKDGPR